MFHRVRSLVGKLALIQTSFLVLALASIAFTLWVSWQLEGGAGAINEAGRMRMLSCRMTVAHAEGRTAELERDARDFDAMVVRLREGDAERPLFVPDNPACRERLRDVEQRWPQLRQRLLSDPAPSRLSQQTDAFVAHIDALVSAIEHTIAKRDSHPWRPLLQPGGACGGGVGGVRLGHLCLDRATAAAPARRLAAHGRRPSGRTRGRTGLGRGVSAAWPLASTRWPRPCNRPTRAWRAR